MFDIEVDISEIAKARKVLELFGVDDFTNTAEAVIVSVGVVKQQWQYVAGATLKHSTGAYNNSIVEEYELDGDPLAGRAICTHPAAHWLENGHMGSFDMKKALQTSDKVKVSKTGKRYLVIPFRHGTPGATTMRSSYEKAGTNQMKRISGMPKNVFSKAKPLSPSVRNPETGKTKWGGRLPAGTSDKGFKGKIKPKHKADPFSGMVRIPKQGGGSEYITFRVMTEDSKGWIHPGNPALRIAERARAMSEEPVRTVILAAVERDVAYLEEEMSRA